MRKKKLRRKILWAAVLLFLAGTPFWVDFPELFGKLKSRLAPENTSELSPPPSATKPAGTDVLPKVNEFLRREGDLLPGAKAEVVGIIDLNRDGTWEVVASAETGGAYTTLFAVMEYKNGALSYLGLVDREGEIKKAQFVDGSSVRHANAFKIFDDSKRGKAYVQLTGESDETGTKWTWDVAVYSWNGSAFRHNKVLSEKIAAGDPQEFFREEDYLDKLFQGN